MSKPIELSPEQKQWLTENHDKQPLTHTARSLGMCVDTLKRHLVKMELREFEGAKYVLPRYFEAKKKSWTRPCMDCKDTKPRPKGYYFCAACRRKRGYDDED